MTDDIKDSEDVEPQVEVDPDEIMKSISWTRHCYETPGFFKYTSQQNA